MRLFVRIGSVGAVIVSGTIGQLALHFLEKYKILVMKIMSKFEMRRLAQVRAPGPSQVPLEDILRRANSICARVSFRCAAPS